GPPSLHHGETILVCVCSLDVRVPESPAVALFGTDAVLNCSFSGVSEFNLSELSVFWQLSDTKRAVHSFWQSRDQLSDQEERFSNRTSLFPDQLPAGNASLLLRRVRVADEGSYLCFVTNHKSHGTFSFSVQVYLCSAFQDANHCKAALQKMLLVVKMTEKYSNVKKLYLL
uniref:CD276 molecule n=1 Tax=Cyprinus carpio TaxID=7962 RepID=A0A8C2EC64_CYPCA